MALIKRKQLNIGDRAGSLGCQGYWRLKVDGRSYLSSRLAVFYMTGEWPLSEIDHKDLDHANDRWNNLRPATHSQNIANTKAIAKSGLKGALEQASGRFMSRIRFQGKLIYLGTFDTKEESNAAYAKKAKEFFGEFARVS